MSRAVTPEALPGSPGPLPGDPGAVAHALNRLIAQLIKADVGLEIAFAELGGWDHHVNEGGATGQLATRLTGNCMGGGPGWLTTSSSRGETSR